MSKKKEEYPRLKQLGIKVYEERPSYVKWSEVDEALDKHSIDLGAFSIYYGIQSQGPNGPYPDDVEACLERMLSGRLTGTQLLWD